MKQSTPAARTQAIPLTIARPFAKWAGGKTALLHEILPRLPAKIDTYYEPFLGGGAVFFALAQQNRFKHAVLNDANIELIDTYRAIARDVDGIISALSEHVYEKSHYYSVRALDPRALDLSSRAARFIYLNRTGFNGLYRVNSRGVFNVPFGRYTNPTICDEDNLRAVSEILRKSSISFHSTSFDVSVAHAQKRDAVYCDPPYAPVSRTSNFTNYAAGGFTAIDQVRLHDVAQKLINRGVHVLLSNADVPFVQKLYENFKIEEVQAPRRVNSKGDKRGNVGELLISGGAK